MIIQIIGQAGSGKTALAEALTDRINAIHINADKVRADLNKDLGFDEETDLVIFHCGLYDWSKPTTLMLGRYQPWHEGHHALYREAQKRTDQVVLGVRNTYGTSEKDPLTFKQVKGFIEADTAMIGAMVVKFPNITNIVYGRDVGYKIEQVKLGDEIEAISATQKRREMGL